MKKRPKTNAAAARKSKDAKSHLRAQRAVSKHAASKTPLQYVPWHTIPLEELNPLLQRQFVVGQEIVVHSGEVLCIPAHMPHKAEALEDTVDLDVFNPPRADWINKTDQYLRGQK